MAFLFLALASVAVAIYLSSPDLFVEWRDKLTGGSGEASEVIPEAGALEVSGLRAWRDANAEVRIRAALTNHQMAAAPAGDYEVLIIERDGNRLGRVLGRFQATLDEPLAGNALVEVDAPLDAPQGLADFPHWSELVGRVRPLAAPVADSGE